jgi:hypothetical protein
MPEGAGLLKGIVALKLIELYIRIEGGYTTTISGGTFLGSNVTSMTHNKKPNFWLGLHIISDYLGFVKNCGLAKYL